MTLRSKNSTVAVEVATHALILLTERVKVLTVQKMAQPLQPLCFLMQDSAVQFVRMDADDVEPVSYSEGLGGKVCSNSRCLTLRLQGSS